MIPPTIGANARNPAVADPFPKSHALERLIGFNFRVTSPGEHIGIRWPTYQSAYANNTLLPCGTTMRTHLLRTA